MFHFGFRCRLAFLLTCSTFALGCGDGGSDSGPPGLDDGADHGTVDIDGGGGIDIEARSDGSPDVADAATNAPDGRPLDAVTREVARESDVSFDATNDGADVVGVLIIDAAIPDTNRLGLDAAPMDGGADVASWNNLDEGSRDAGQDCVDNAVEHSPNKRHFAFTESHPKSLITPDLSTPRRALLHPTLPGC